MMRMQPCSQELTVLQQCAESTKSKEERSGPLPSLIQTYRLCGSFWSWKRKGSIQSTQRQTSASLESAVTALLTITIGFAPTLSISLAVRTSMCQTKKDVILRADSG